MTLLVDTAAELRAALAQRAGRVAVVMTMGALHDGHRSLMAAARGLVGEAGTVVVTVFVNPLQFGPGEDFARYPRTLDADLEVCRGAGVDVVLAPAVEEVYPRPQQVTVDPGPLAAQLEGAVRPGHFGGVLTVVLKLLHLVGPDVAVFGEKDYQQLVLVRGMVADLAVPVEVVGAPTVREPDGLARSSRNRYLSPGERTSALALSRALTAGVRMAATGRESVLTAARAVLDAEPGVALDYLELRDPELGPAPERGPARLLVAARVGATRLIDNVDVLLGGA
ncbi:pantothenate synthetase [Motilibacter rhizosphaerae]|uniref:Pantothenate synthetase n=1 Tax=Motilibacter rhizosphaerae TaxID=598652 RepID=A0A4Q7NAR5_9ACTN|nr:pantoate--beta-alanine ligase [Motilibacter rhizosphaerae]RZS79452.1 pantothenate synthetase [Motilibacter rhizosphaerae]